MSTCVEGNPGSGVRSVCIERIKLFTVKRGKQQRPRNNSNARQNVWAVSKGYQLELVEAIGHR